MADKNIKYSIEKRTADERFIMTTPGIDYRIGDEYFVVLETKIRSKYSGTKTKYGYIDTIIIAWTHTEEDAWFMLRFRNKSLN
jgi:hypothetical protein